MSRIGHGIFLPALGLGLGGIALAATQLPVPCAPGACGRPSCAACARTPSRARPEQTASRDRLPYERFSPARLDALTAERRPVFVNLTAAWCITCLVNEHTTLDTAAVRQAFTEHQIVALKGDWTRQDPAITRMLEANGRAGVPLYLFYPKPGPQGERRGPIILPQILTAATILREMQSQ